MIGIPTEKRKDIFKTIALNKKANPDVADVSIIYPFPGTKFTDYCIKNDLIDKTNDKINNIRTTSVLIHKSISKKTLYGLNKTFQLYYFFPKIMYPFIWVAEGENIFSKVWYGLLSKLHNKIRHR